MAEMNESANQLFKKYKQDGGSLNFSDWLNKQKSKGIFPINENLDNEIKTTLNEINENDKNMNKTVLGFPVKTLYIVGGIIVAAIVINQILKKK
jgi:hypothetical protein